MTSGLTDARRHAITASELLDQLDQLRDHAKKLTPEERLQLAAGGGIARLNADMQFTIDAATAHALTAAALAATEDS